MAALAAGMLALLAAPFAGGCSTAVSRYFTLAPTVTETLPSGAPVRVLVGPVTVPEGVDRPQFVIQVSANRVEIDDLNRWATPLDEGIASTIVADLQTLLGTRNVAIAPLASFDATHRVTVDVQRFDSIPGNQVAIDALWSVIAAQPYAKSQSGRTLASEPLEQTGPEAIAAAHGRALGKIAREIAAAIRVEAPAKSKSKTR